MRAMASRLSIVSAERITDELTKLMLTPVPEAGLDLLVRTGVAEVVLPELPAVGGMEVDEHHRHKDVYTHSLIVLRQAIDLEPRYGLGPDPGAAARGDPARHRQAAHAVAAAGRQGRLPPPRGRRGEDGAASG